eukprot:scpid110091/ scgid23229/ 
MCSIQYAFATPGTQSECVIDGGLCVLYYYVYKPKTVPVPMPLKGASPSHCDCDAEDSSRGCQVHDKPAVCYSFSWQCDEACCMIVFSTFFVDNTSTLFTQSLCTFISTGKMRFSKS